MSDEPIKAIQADREAAGKIFRAIGREQSARLAELGRGGDGPVTLVLAAHRLAAIKDADAVLEETAKIGKGELELFPHRSDWKETRHTVMSILEDYMEQEPRDCPFGWYRILSASFGFDLRGARLFSFTYQVLE